jgi:hypothetical protein
MSVVVSDVEGRRALVVDDCQKMIDWYEKNKRVPRRLYYVSQTATIVLSAVTPVLILWEELPKAVQALPAAVAGIAAGLNAVYRWRENWVLRAHTSELMKRELVKFRARASEHYRADLGEQEAIDNFVGRIESITMGELSEWRVLQLQSAKEGHKSG